MTDLSKHRDEVAEALRDVTPASRALSLLAADALLAPDGIVARIAAEAWDRGNRHGHRDRQGYDLADGCGPDPWDCDCPNPYRDAQTDTDCTACEESR